MSSFTPKKRQYQILLIIKLQKPLTLHQTVSYRNLIAILYIKYIYIYIANSAFT